MTRKKMHQPKVERQATTQGTDAPQAHKNTGDQRTWLRLMRKLPYTLIFVCLYFFVTLTYGDVFARTLQESFVCNDANAMEFLTKQDNGLLYLWGRYALLIFHSVWFGGLIFTLMLLGIAALLDRAFRLPLWLRGLSGIVPVGLLFYFTTQGIKLYYKSEPSLFLLQTIGVFLLALVLGTVLPKFIKRSTAAENPPLKGWRKVPAGLLLSLLSYGGLQAYAHSVEGENTILTARMQNRVTENDLTTLVPLGLSAQQPTRSVAAYYALGLLHNDAMLEHLFDISFHFPNLKMRENDGSNEYGIFNSDCCFYSGLLNASYRTAMDHIVMDGPRIYYLKRMALCAILKQEKALAEKYLAIISKVPFENDFVEQYRPYVDNPELIKQNYTFSKLLELTPIEQRFEQNYRTPVFLGYYVGILQGSNEALAPSMAACLYSKDLPNLAQRALQYKQVGKSLPMSVMEALSIYSRKNPVVFKYFPELDESQTRIPHPAVANVNNFFITIQHFFQEKYNGDSEWRVRMSKELNKGISDELRAQLSANWLGHYAYYYYCENVFKKDQEKKKTESSVN